MFRFNKDSSEQDQVAEYLPAFKQVLAEIEGAGQYRYNDSFKGRIPGIEGPDEDRAIYRLQQLERIEAERVEVAHAIDEGYKPVEDGAGRQRFASILLYRPGYYSGGTGKINRYEDARLVFEAGRPVAVLPKGARTRGYAVEGGQVFAK